MWGERGGRGRESAGGAADKEPLFDAMGRDVSKVGPLPTSRPPNESHWLKTARLRNEREITLGRLEV